MALDQFVVKFEPPGAVLPLPLVVGDLVPVDGARTAGLEVIRTIVWKQERHESDVTIALAGQGNAPMQCSVTLPRKVSKLLSLTIEKTEATIHQMNRTSRNCVHSINREMRTGVIVRRARTLHLKQLTQS